MPAGPQKARPSLAYVKGRQMDAHLAADPTYATLVMRRISPYLTWLIVRFTPISADMITWGSIVSAVAAAALLLYPSAPSFLAAVVLLQLSYLFDVSDGEVARIRGTAGKRGAYLDLVGHHIQDHCLWLAAGYQLASLSAMNPYVIAVVLLSIAFADPFGIQARSCVLGTVDLEDPVHGIHRTVTLPERMSLTSLAYYSYRRGAFLWNYPAAMNLFCVAILADAGRLAVMPGVQPLLLPLLYLVFGPTRAAKQLANAFRLLRRVHWA